MTYNDLLGKDFDVASKLKTQPELTTKISSN